MVLSAAYQMNIIQMVFVARMEPKGLETHAVSLDKARLMLVESVVILVKSTQKIIVVTLGISLEKGCAVKMGLSNLWGSVVKMGQKMLGGCVALREKSRKKTSHLEL